MINDIERVREQLSLSNSKIAELLAEIARLSERLEAEKAIAKYRLETGRSIRATTIEECAKEADAQAAWYLEREAKHAEGARMCAFRIRTLNKPIRVLANTSTFLGYRNAKGEEMHCAHAKCPSPDMCIKGCVCPVPRREAMIGYTDKTVVGLVEEIERLRQEREDDANCAVLNIEAAHRERSEVTQRMHEAEALLKKKEYEIKRLREQLADAEATMFKLNSSEELQSLMKLNNTIRAATIEECLDIIEKANRDGTGLLDVYVAIRFLINGH